MSIFRLYTGADGQSHIEEMDLISHPDLAAAQGATSVIFRESPSGSFSDWHNAPRRQYIVTLSGEMEIGLGDGSVHLLGVGAALLAEDLTGQGHTTRNPGATARVSVTVPLAD